MNLINVLNYKPVNIEEEKITPDLDSWKEMQEFEKETYTVKTLDSYVSYSYNIKRVALGWKVEERIEYEGEYPLIILPTYTEAYKWICNNGIGEPIKWVTEI